MFKTHNKIIDCIVIQNKNQSFRAERPLGALWAECKTIASATYDTLAFLIWTRPECKSVASANVYFLFFSVNLVF